MVDNMRLPDDEGDWDDRYSQQAESYANLIWDMPLTKIYETTPDPRVEMWCEWIQEAVFAHWLGSREEAAIGEDADRWVKARKEDALLEGVNEHKEQ